MTELIKYYFLILSACYAYICMLKPSCRNSVIKAASIILPGMLSVLTYLINIYASHVRIPGMLFLSFLFFTIVFRIPWKVSASATLLSFGCSYLFFTVCAFIFSTIEFIFLKGFDHYKIVPFLAFFLGLLQFLGVVCLFHTKRLRHGLPFLWSTGNSYTGTFISIAILTAVSFLSLNDDLHFIYFVLIFSILVWGTALLIWWKERITKKYMDQVNARTAKELEETISAKDSEIAYLRKQNETLAKMIHKDNKLIPAMEYSVRELFRSAADNMENTPLRKKTLELLGELEHIFEDRNGLLRDYETTGKQLPPTGIVSVDILLAYILQRAAKQNISFDVIIPEEIRSVEERIDREDLRTLLADLLENALIAASESDCKKVLLTMEIKDGFHTVNVYDSGSPFSQEVLSNFGSRPVTTHKDHGGSGIGLMTVSELCAKYHAGFTVEELAGNSSYCKKVSICFS